LGSSARASRAHWRPPTPTRKGTVEDVQAALDAIRVKDDWSMVKPASINAYVAAVKSFLGFAQRVGYTRFNAAPLIKADICFIGPGQAARLQ